MTSILAGVFPKSSLNTVACLFLGLVLFFAGSATAEQVRLSADPEVRYAIINDQVKPYELLTTNGLIKYGYDKEGRLTTLTFADHSVRSYHYTDGKYPKLLTGITDQAGVRFATDQYDGLAKIAFSTAPNLNANAGVLSFDGETPVGETSKLCPNTIFDDGKMWSGDLHYVDNICSAEGKICASAFFAGLYEHHAAICSNNVWELAKPTIELEQQDRCPNGVFDNGKMWNSEIQLVDNSCTNQDRICPGTYFSSHDRYFEAVCSGVSWQPVGLDLSASDMCPNTIFPDGSMLTGDFQLKDNSCSSIKQICPNTWYPEEQVFSGSVCDDGKWEKQPRGTDVIKDSGPIAVELPIGGGIGWLWLSALSVLVVRRRIA